MKKTIFPLFVSLLFIFNACQKSPETNCRLEKANWDSMNAAVYITYTGDHPTMFTHTSPSYIDKLEYSGDTLIKFLPYTDPGYTYYEQCVLNNNKLPIRIDFKASDINANSFDARMDFYYNSHQQIDSVIKNSWSNGSKLSFNKYYISYNSQGNVAKIILKNYQGNSLNAIYGADEDIEFGYDTNSRYASRIEFDLFLDQKFFRENTPTVLAKIFSKNNITSIKEIFKSNTGMAYPRPEVNITYRTNAKGLLIYTGLDYAHYSYSCH